MLRRLNVTLSAPTYTKHRTVSASKIRKSIFLIHTSAATEQHNDKHKDDRAAVFKNGFVSTSNAESYAPQPEKHDCTLKSTSDKLSNDVSKTMFRLSH